MLMRGSFQTSEVALARMVMPRSRSKSLESRARSATRWFSRNEPDCCSRRSTRVVLPWSTWAIMAILRRFMGLADSWGLWGRVLGAKNQNEPRGARRSGPLYSHFPPRSNRRGAPRREADETRRSARRSLSIAIAGRMFHALLITYLE